MPDTYPPPKTERKSIIPVLAQKVSTIPTVVRERVSGFFEKPVEPPKSKQGILTDFLFKSTNGSIDPKLMAKILLGECKDKKLLEAFEEHAKVIYPEAVQFFREKIDAMD